MLIQIDHHSGVPAYRQLIEQIKLQIALGELSPGDPLPSTRALSAEIDLNPMTISKAYSLLERDGHLVRQRGKPLTVAASSAEEQTCSIQNTLREALAPAAALSHQLGLSKEEALETFRALLNQTNPS